MSDYLTNLLTRTRHPERTIQPRISSLFDPVSSNLIGEEVRGWGPGDEPYPAVGVNQPVSRRDPSMWQFLEVTGQDQEDVGSHREREARHREWAAVSTADGERLTPSSETASMSELKEVDLEMNSVSNIVAPNSRYSETHGVSSRNPPDAQAIDLSPIDSTVVSVSPSRVRVRPSQERTASWPESVAQSPGSSLRMPSEQTKTVEKGERSLLRDESSSETPDISSVAPTTQAYDQELNSSNTPAGRGNLASSRQPLVGAATARSDGKQLHRLPTIVNESGEALAETRKQAAAGLNVSDISLDPSLVAPVRTTKSAAPSQHPMSRQSAGDASGTVSSTLDQQERNATPRMSPKISNNFLARRRSVAPMTAASVSQASATERGKPVEPVVHVTIGRVEVRAVAPPVRQEKGRKPSSAMSLDDYLKRRGGRSGG